MTTSEQHSFVIVKYQGRDTAKEALSSLLDLEAEGIVDLADAAAVYKTRRGRIKLDQTRELSTRKGAALGGAVGLVIGIALGGPVAVALAGSAAGGVGARLKDSGISDETLKALRDDLAADESALALLAASADWETLRERMSGFDHQVLAAHFTDEVLREIRQVVEDEEALGAVADELTQPDPPYNILFLTTDQEYAHPPRPPGYSLPYHDQLRSRGLAFRNYQVSTGLCTPSRSVMYTGRHAPETGMWDNTNMAWIDDMEPGLQTIGHMLRQVGFYTAFKGKWHLSEVSDKGAVDALEPYGFSDYQDFGEVWGEALDGFNRDPDIAADAAEWLSEKAPEISETQPWFLAVNLCNPHDIMYYDADPAGDTQAGGLFPMKPAPDDPLYDQRWETELPDTFGDELAQHPAAVGNYPRTGEVAFGEMPRDRTEMWHSYINYYLNCLRDADRHIGTILDALDTSGLWDTTIVVFTSDHGDMLASHSLRQKGPVPFKEVWNVPFIVIHPDQGGGRATEAVGATVDIVPTLLELTGVSARQRAVLFPQLRGEDLSPVIGDAASDGPRGSSTSPGMGSLMTYDTLSAIDMEFVAAVASAMVDLGDEAGETETAEQQGKLHKARELLRAVREADFSQRHVLRGVYDGRYKLVRFFAINEHNLPETLEDLYRHNDVALYDLVNDPDELENLANRDHPKYDKALVVEMNDKLNSLIRTELGNDPNLVDRPLLTMLASGAKSGGKD